MLLVYNFKEHLFHDLVSGKVGVDGVARIAGIHGAVFRAEGGIVVSHGNPVPGGICLYEAVELLYLRPGVTDALAPADLAGQRVHMTGLMP